MGEEGGVGVVGTEICDLPGFTPSRAGEWDVSEGSHLTGSVPVTGRLTPR